jgi:hypothetical protein
VGGWGARRTVLHYSQHTLLFFFAIWYEITDTIKKALLASYLRARMLLKSGNSQRSQTIFPELQKF